MGPRAALAADGAASDHDIKAAFLFHFSKFVQWPDSAFAARNTPLLICVVGDDPFGSLLEELVRNEMADGRPIAVERYRLAGSIDRCHILFVGQTDKVLQKKILQRARGRNILTVSDDEDFTRRGGVIGFVTVKGKIKLQVNRSSAERADLRISSRLLRLADEVG